MIKKIIVFITVFSSVFAQYSVGDVVNVSDQSVSQSTCYPGNGYDIGDLWKLGDWNGATNGGNYNVIFIDMSASW